MKKRIIIVFACILQTVSVFSFDLLLEGKISNMGFPWVQIAPTAADVTNLAVDQLFWGTRLSGSESIDENLHILAGLDMDPVMRNTLSATLEYRLGFLKISAGPVFGLFNSPTIFLKSGISSGFELDWPGVGFARAATSSSLGGGLQIAGDYLQESSDFGVGLYLRNIICSLNLYSKKFQYQASPQTMTSDLLTEYSFKADLFKKNVPYNIMVTLGYRNLAKSFVIAGVQTNDALGAAIAGAKITISPIRQLRLITDLEGAVYTFGLENLVARGPAMNSFIFKAGVGVSWSFDTEKTPVKEETPEIPIREPETKSDNAERPDAKEEVPSPQTN